MASEKNLERKLREAVMKAGGWSFKFTPMGFIGMPDRVILMPGGRIAFAEIKSRGKKPTKVQQARIKMLIGMGFTVAVIDSMESLQVFIERVVEYGIYTA